MLSSNTQVDERVLTSWSLSTGKRALDCTCAVVLLIVAAPLMLLIAALVKITSSGPVFFRQKRVGQSGEGFQLLKFRTMYHSIENGGPLVTRCGDRRVTSVGKWLRKFSFDELPQVFNVLKGDMSLVGPRPEVPRYVDMNNPLWKLVLEARPGITDRITLSLRNEEALLAAANADREEFYLNTLQPFKLQGYLSYLRERSFWRDVKVLVHTCGAVVLPGSAPPPTIQGNSTKRG